MKHKSFPIYLLLVSISAVLSLDGCSKATVQADGLGVPPPTKLLTVSDSSLFTVEHPDQFPLAEATQHATTSELVVTGTVTPDVSSQVPVPSLATGRIVEIDARLGDEVKKASFCLRSGAQTSRARMPTTGRPSRTNSLQ